MTRTAKNRRANANDREASDRECCDVRSPWILRGGRRKREVMGSRLACGILLVIAGCTSRPTFDAVPWWMVSFGDNDADTLALGETICTESDRIMLDPARAEAIVVHLADERVMQPGKKGGPPVWSSERGTN